MQSSGQSGHSGSDEEKKPVIQEDLPDSTPQEVADQDYHQDVEDHKEFPCLFHSYLTRCAKGQFCNFSHSIHADQVRVPSAKTRRGTARKRIQRRLEQHFNAANLYQVHEHLQKEAQRDHYARELISIWELTSGRNGMGPLEPLDMMDMDIGRHPHPSISNMFKYLNMLYPD